MEYYITWEYIIFSYIILPGSIFVLYNLYFDIYKKLYKFKYVMFNLHQVNNYS